MRLFDLRENHCQDYLSLSNVSACVMNIYFKHTKLYSKCCEGAIALRLVAGVII